MNNWVDKSVLVLVWLLMVQNGALAYDKTTHEGFSEYAANNTVLASDLTLLRDLGLSPYGTREFTNSDSDPNTIQEIVAFGSVFEDDLPTLRFTKHFYDPQSGSGLAGFYTSPDWALENCS